MSAQYPAIAPMSQQDLKDSLGINETSTDDDRLLNDIAGSVTRLIEDVTGPILLRPPVTVECTHVWEHHALVRDEDRPGVFDTGGEVQQWDGDTWVTVDPTDYRVRPARGARAKPTLDGWFERLDTYGAPACWNRRVRVVDWRPGRFLTTTEAAEVEDGMPFVNAFQRAVQLDWFSWVAHRTDQPDAEYDSMRPWYPASQLPRNIRQQLQPVSPKRSLMAGARV